MSVRNAAEAFVAVLLFGCIPVVVRSVSANAYTIGIVRLTIATIVLAAIMAARRELHRVAPRDLVRLAIIGFLFFAHWLTLFLAIKASSASIGAIGLSTYGVNLLILGVLFAGDRPRAIDIVAVLLAAAGAALVVPALTLRNDVAFGMALSCLSALLYASLPLLHQRWSDLPSNTRTLGQFGFALLFFLFFAAKTEWTLSGRDWVGLLFLAIGVTLIAHSLWVRVTTRHRPSVTSIIYYTNIPIAIILSVAVLREPLTARMVSGSLLIIAGSLLDLSARFRRT